MPAGRMSNMRKYAHKIKQLVAISPAPVPFSPRPRARPPPIQIPLAPLGLVCCHFGVFGWLLVFNLGSHKRNAEPQVLGSEIHEGESSQANRIYMAAHKNRVTLPSPLLLDFCVSFPEHG